MRIRTIKPEFWTSESVGRLSREARLLFIGLWSFAEDSGRGRGALPAISGALFPYDKDALDKLDGWMNELEKEGMIRRYKGPDGNSYYDMPKWLKHQKIEKPSQARLPAFTDCSPNTPRILPDSSVNTPLGNREPVPCTMYPVPSTFLGVDESEKEGPDGREIELPIGETATDFDAFWSVYPRKVSKGDARRAFKGALKKATVGQMIEAVKKQAEWVDWLREGGKFIPYPASWLNSEGWLNEEPKIKANGTPSPASSPKTAFALKLKLESIETQIKQLMGSGYESAFGLHFSDPADKAEWRRLHDEKDKVIKEMSNL